MVAMNIPSFTIPLQRCVFYELNLLFINLFQNDKNENYPDRHFANEFGFLFPDISIKKLPERVFQLAGECQNSFSGQLWGIKAQPLPYGLRL
jgi:hypothetical protein